MLGDLVQIPIVPAEDFHLTKPYGLVEAMSTETI
jgi:hypothetical protein